MGLFEAPHRGAQAVQGELEQFRVLLRAGGFVGGDLREPGDALGLFPCVLDNSATSDFSVPSNCSSSCRRSSLMASAPWIRASIFPMVSSIMALLSILESR